MLYPKNGGMDLEKGLFENPSSEYRGAPFWSWNCKLEKEIILYQIKVFREMGFGGFLIHARTGLETPYLGPEFMEYVKLCGRQAAEEGMLCWLYDEDRYPSGAAGGMVTRELKYRARHLLISQNNYEGFEPSREAFNRCIEAGGKPAGYYAATYSVLLENGCLSHYERVLRDTGTGRGQRWHAYVRLSEEDPWFNGQTYVDVLNKTAIRQFIETTHERYYKVLGEEFGKSVPAIFTDEPQVSRKSTLPFAACGKDTTLSFTDDLPDTYRLEYGEELLDLLPELLWELPEGKVSPVRYRYHNHLADRFAASFSDTLGMWCEQHNIALTGHFMSERTLYSQSLALGEAMRCYRSFQLPGIDILCDARELSTAKQAASAAHQYGREGVLSELYGVTHWYFDFKGHKLQGDWQAALGITIRVPHLAFMSMAGESKRDWPASIGCQSPWYKKYPYVEDHFARLNTALTRGRCEISVAVIHPIESFWLTWGPNDQTGMQREQQDKNFEDLLSWLLYGMMDFDFISEALLPELCDEGSNPLCVGQMKYTTVVVPCCRTLRATTVKRLEDFAKAGGHILFAGTVPDHVDAVPSPRVKDLSRQCMGIEFSRAALLQALEHERRVEVRLPGGYLSDNLFYQLRGDNGCKWLFICHVNRKRNRVDEPVCYRIKVKGVCRPYLYDTRTGEITPCPAEVVGNDTVILREMYAEDSILLRLEQGFPAQLKNERKPMLKEAMKLEGPVEFICSEPNVLLLDRAEYSFDGGGFHPEEEVLRIDNLFRDALGYPRRMDHMIQPYLQEAGREEGHFLTLRYRVRSETVVREARLAMEGPEAAEIFLNGELVRAIPDGYFTDRAIQTVPLPELVKGVNELVLKIPFVPGTNVEWCYLLGDFGVRVAGADTCLEEAPQKLAFGDWVPQGLPFYAGNITYRCPLQLSCDIENAVLEIPHFSSPVMEIFLDGEVKGLIAYSPHRQPLGKMTAGRHMLEITVFGNRYNAFGTLHNANDEFKWYGPDSYRTTGSQWTETYLLRPMGVLSRPLIWSGSNEDENDREGHL